MSNKLLFLALFLAPLSMNCYGQCPPCSNQTANLSIPLPEDSLPYQISVAQADFSLPAGLQSFAFAVYKGEWLFIAGRTNGLHNVNSNTPLPNSFPVKNQNTVVYVVNPKKKVSYSRSLSDPSSGLTQEQIDLLSVTNSFYHQAHKGKTLYLIGGYGINTATGAMETKQALTAIDVPKLIAWVKNKSKSAEGSFRFAFDPILQVTGGKMLKGDKDGAYLLAFGQNFSGFYTTSSNGDYSMQIRRIEIIDDGCELFVKAGQQPDPLPTYRRRDLNVVPVVKKNRKSCTMAYVALSGVFTPGDQANPGAWTVPIEIEANGSSHMLDPNDPSTLAQAMNNYDCANVGLYSKKRDCMYTLLFGGISASIFSDGDCANSCVALIPPEGNVFTICCNLPFTNDITTIMRDKRGVYRQFLMSSKFPTISVPDPASLFCSDDPFPPDAPRIYYFGAEAVFIPNQQLLAYPNNVIAFDFLERQKIFLGYIVGGIASTILDTNCVTDTIASPYVFKVYIYPKRSSKAIVSEH